MIWLDGSRKITRNVAWRSVGKGYPALSTPGGSVLGLAPRLQAVHRSLRVPPVAGAIGRRVNGVAELRQLTSRHLGILLHRRRGLTVLPLLQ